MPLSGKISVFVGKTGEILAANPFYGRRVPAAPGGYKLLSLDRPTFNGSPVSDEDVKTNYEIDGEILVRK